MGWPEVRAQVAFDTAPLATPTWTTIHEGTTTQRVLEAQCRHGRSFELDAFQPGQLTLELENSDRRFDPLHASGPYYGKLLPRKRCRLQADWGAAFVNPSTGWCSTPDAAALDVTGDIDLRARAALTDWTPAGNSCLVGKGGVGSDFSYTLHVSATTGVLTLYWSENGTVVKSASSTVAPTVSDASTLWVRATLDVNDGAGNRVVKFYTSTDDTHDHAAVTWTQLGSTVTTAGTTSIWASAQPLELGAYGSGFQDRTTGKVYAAAVLNGIGGTVVANVDFTDGNRWSAGATSGTDSTGLAWTINAPGSLAAQTYDVFSGFVDSWPQEYGRFQAVAQMTATDGLKILSRIDIAGAYEEVVRGDGPTGWWRLGDNTPTVDLCADSSGNGYDGSYKGSPTGVDGIVPGGSSDGAVDFDGANDRVVMDPLAWPAAPPFSVEAWVRTSAAPTGVGMVIVGAGPVYSTPASFGWDVGLAMQAGGVPTDGWNAGPAINDGLVHHLVTTVTGGSTISLYVDGVLAGSTFYSPSAREWVRVGSPPAIVAGSFRRFDGIIDEVAVYDVALTTTQVAAHYNAGADMWAGDTTGARIGRVLDLAGWPTADRDLDTGRSTMGAYGSSDSNILAAAQEAETTEGGALWQAPNGDITFRDRHAPIQDWNATVSQAAFTDDGTATNPNHYTALELAYDDQLIVNEAEVAWTDGTETSRDTASITAYTRQAVRIDTALTTAPEARDRGDWLLARYSGPSVRPERVVLRPAADSRLWRHCLTRKIGDRVTVRRLPQNTGAAIEFDATIESIAHRIADGKNVWETEFGLSPTAVDLGWLILDDTAEGLLDTGRLAF